MTQSTETISIWIIILPSIISGLAGIIGAVIGANVSKSTFLATSTEKRADEIRNRREEVYRKVIDVINQLMFLKPPTYTIYELEKRNAEHDGKIDVAETTKDSVSAEEIKDIRDEGNEIELQIEAYKQYLNKMKDILNDINAITIDSTFVFYASDTAVDLLKDFDNELLNFTDKNNDNVIYNKVWVKATALLKQLKAEINPSCNTHQPTRRP